MSLLEAIILGIIQGLTEFLPVSSSGHIELVKALFGNGLSSADSLLFTIVVHGATALSTVVVFRNDLIRIFLGLFQKGWNEQKRFSFMILLSMVPVFFVGMFLREYIESLFDGELLLVGICLLITAALLYFTTRIPENTEGRVTPVGAIVVGISQALAVLPGISRSGATISTALFLGISREQAARFSFLMVLPVILGAMVVEAGEFSGSSTAPAVGTTALIAGFTAAFVAGVFACKWMIALVKKSKLDYFAYYCTAVGALAITYALWN